MDKRVKEVKIKQHEEVHYGQNSSHWRYRELWWESN